MRKGMLRTKKCAAEIDVDDSLPVFVIKFGDGAAHRDPRTIDQDVDRPELGTAFREGITHFILGSDVHRERKSP
jgi:hypothetical protein